MSAFKPHLLILEDDPDLRFIYEHALSPRYELTFFESLQTLKEALDLGVAERSDLLIADVRLTDGTFIDFVANCFFKIAGIKFIVVSSIDDVDVLRYCYERGAMDYLVKPFQRSELIVKIEKALGRFNVPATGATATSGIKVPLSELTPKEKAILELFVRSPSNSLSRDEILMSVWQTSKVSEKAVDVHLSHLRQKIRRSGYTILLEAETKWKLCPVDQISTFEEFEPTLSDDSDESEKSY